jgi:hypothetical protein
MDRASARYIESPGLELLEVRQITDEESDATWPVRPSVTSSPTT